MKSVRAYFLFFVLAVILVFGLQIIWVIYSPVESFNMQVEDHLVSVAQIKGERIDDYFLERKRDVEVLAASVEVRELLGGETGRGDIIIGENIEKSLEIIARQVEIYVSKYPDVSFGEWKEDVEFLKVAEREIGVNGFSRIVDYDNFDRDAFDYSESVGVVSGDGVNLGVAVLIDFDEFKILANPDFDLVISMERFRDISGYENLILIDRDGYVVYEVDRGFEFGTNLNLNIYRNSFLGKAYSVLEVQDSIVYGPYLEIGESELGLFFLARVFDGDEFMGVIVLEDSMKDVDDIVMEDFGFVAMSGDSYVVDEEKFLITSAKGGEFDLMVQQVWSENVEKCFEGDKETGTYFTDFKGVDVIGSYIWMSEAGWCLVAEVAYDEVFEIPKKRVGWDLFFIVGLGLVLLIVGWKLENKFKEKGK